MQQTKTILITGATGYLGSYITKRLVAGGYRVAVLVRPRSQLDRLSGVLDSIQVFDAACLEETFQKLGVVDVVIHTATNYGRNATSVMDVFRANIAFPVAVMDAAARYGSKAFINTDTVLDPALNTYALSKHQLREWGRYFARKGILRFVNLRLEHFYGPGDEISKFTTYLIRSCLHNEPSIQLTPGAQKRDFIYIEDVVDAYICVVDGLASIDDGYVDIDVGSGVAVAIRDFVEMVKSIMGASIRLDFGALPYRENEAMYAQADISGLLALGWRNKHSLRDGLDKTIAIEREVFHLTKD